MRDETKEFIESWDYKLRQINSAGDDLKELYDKFVTLYTIYNRYYNEAYYVLKNSNKLIKSRYSDYEKATIIVLEFLGANEIIKNFDKNGDTESIDQVRKLINNIFHINLADGIPDIENDRQLATNLGSEIPNIKAKAILSLIYNVRCNIVHGYKEFKEYQRLIVEPLVSLLETLTNTFQHKFES